MDQPARTMADPNESQRTELQRITRLSDGEERFRFTGEGKFDTDRDQYAGSSIFLSIQPGTRKLLLSI